MLEWAYGLPARDIIGGPDWVREKTFDIDARTGSQETTRLQLLLMLRSLLRERFSLDAEFETREGNRYALMVVRADGKLGPEMHPSTATCGRRTPGGTFYDPTNGPLKMDNCGVAVASGNGRVSFLGGMRATADDLARSISPHLDRPVVDKTGLTVEYDFIAGIPRAPIDATGGEIFTMIREQLGLKLQPERGDVRLLVIRSIAQPTPN